MRTLKELQAEIEKLQKELEMRQMLCALVHEKYAICFKPTRIDSGYSMGEVVVYTCDGKEIYREDNRKFFRTMHREPYRPKPHHRAFPFQE